MTNVRMYRLNLDNLGEIELISQQQYIKASGLSQDYINKVFNAKLAVKLAIAKFIISLAYNISVRDNEQMQKLLDKHFTLVK